MFAVPVFPEAGLSFRLPVKSPDLYSIKGFGTNSGFELVAVIVKV